MSDTGKIYICIEREFRTSQIKVYKIGYTEKEDISKYIKQRYPKNSKLLFGKNTNQVKLCEKIIIKKCDIKFNKRRDIGSEYYEISSLSNLQNLIIDTIEKGDYKNEYKKIIKEHNKYKLDTKLSKKYLDKWKEIIGLKKSEKKWDECEGHENDNSWECSDNTGIGRQKGNNGLYYIEKGGKRDWMKLPKELGGLKKKVINTAIRPCCCNTHNTKVYKLEGNYLNYWCEERHNFVWRY